MVVPELWSVLSQALSACTSLVIIPKTEEGVFIGDAPTPLGRFFFFRFRSPYEVL